MTNLLLQECLEALQEDVEVLAHPAGENLYRQFEDLYTFVGLKEPWAWIPGAVVLRTMDDLPPDILQSKCYILVSGGDVPVLRTRMDLVAAHFDDVSALDFETYFFACDGTWMAGVYSDDSMAYVRWEDWMDAVRARQDAALSLVAQRLAAASSTPGTPFVEFAPRNRRYVGHTPYIHAAAMADYHGIQQSYSARRGAQWEEEFSKTVFKLAARPDRYAAVPTLPAVYRCDDLRFQPIFYHMQAVDKRVEILAVLDRRWE
jgi:hypothetical protein